jgi:branched-chain amino acid transport system substrate-binding protein
MHMSSFIPTRHALAAAATLTLTAGALSGCGSASLGGDGDDVGDGPVKIGLLIPQSGIYASIGDDLRAGFELYLAEHDDQLGGHEVELIVADEGETADTGRPSAERLIKQDEVLAVSGVVNSAVLNGIVDLVESEEVPLLGSNASPTTLTGVEYIWRTSYVNDEPGKALGEYVAQTVDGPVYLLAADYQAGLDEVNGFKETFLPAGGQVAAEVFSPFPDTTNFQPFLANLEASGAQAAFTFYAGGAAVEFGKQYAQFGLAGSIPHYSAGFMTEGGVLQAQGDAMLGTRTAMNYNHDLEGETNAAFVEAYQAANDRLPTAYAVYSYDAAAVLDEAIEAAGDDLTRETLNEAIGEVGVIDSPRGEWEFNDGGTPRQQWYLREVQNVDGQLVNVVVEELGELG